MKQKIKYQIKPGIVWSGEEPDPHGYVWLADLNQSAELKYLLASHREVFRSVEKKYSTEKTIQILKDRFNLEISKRSFATLLKEMEAAGLVSKL